MLCSDTIICYGAEKASKLHAEHCHAYCHYLCQPELLPQPHQNMLWQALYASQNDRAFITTMGFSVEAFEFILHLGFQDLWDSIAIP
jgi:hypothetical protein